MDNWVTGFGTCYFIVVGGQAFLFRRTFFKKETSLRNINIKRKKEKKMQKKTNYVGVRGGVGGVNCN